MAESKYEKYVTRKPAILKGAGPDGPIFQVPETDEIPTISQVDTGPRLIFSKDFLKDDNSIIEYGFITGDTVIGDGKNIGAHKHDYGEIFLFLGTNPNDTQFLGAEVEFWLDEGEDLEKIEFTTSSSIYVPPGVAHFPMFWRNVKGPNMMVVIVPGIAKLKVIPVRREIAK
jgi:hypothetical protein